MEWSHPQLQQKHKTVFKKPFVNSKCLFPDVDSNRLQWVSLSNREGGGKDASWTAQANTLVKLCMNLCGTNNLTLSAWTLEGHSSARKRYRRFKDAIYIYKRNGWKKKKKSPTSLRWDQRFQTSFLPLTLICLILWSLIEILHKVCKERKQGFSKTIPGLHAVTDNSKGLKTEHLWKTGFMKKHWTSNKCREWKTKSHLYETICKCL